MALLTATQTMGLVWERTHPRVPARPCSRRQPAPHLVPKPCRPAGPPLLCAPGARGEPRVSEHREAVSHRHVVTPQTKIACLRLRWVIFTRRQRWVPAVAWCCCPAHGGSLQSPQPHTPQPASP